MRITLARDLVDANGRTLARCGEEISLTGVAQVSATARREPGQPLSASVVVEDLRAVFAAPALKHLFRTAAMQSSVSRILLSAELPEVLHDELRLLREADEDRYQHGLVTALVSVRMLLAAVGEARALPDLAAAALLHDIGMRHLRAGLTRTGHPLGPADVAEIAAHPLLGAWHLATALGRHPAVEAALGHHWRCGTGYPQLPSPPPRSVQVIAVASAFAALTSPRSFRASPYDARGATDVLVTDARAGLADLESVKLLVHALRGAQGDVRQITFGRERLGHMPIENRKTPIAASAVAA